MRGSEPSYTRPNRSHVEGSRGETLVQQRACRNAKRQVHTEAKEFLSLIERLGLSGLLGSIGIGIALQYFSECAERPLQIVVFIRAIDVINGAKPWLIVFSEVVLVSCWMCDVNARDVVSTVTRHNPQTPGLSHRNSFPQIVSDCSDQASSTNQDFPRTVSPGKAVLASAANTYWFDDAVIHH